MKDDELIDHDKAFQELAASYDEWLGSVYENRKPLKIKSTGFSEETREFMRENEKKVYIDTFYTDGGKVRWKMAPNKPGDGVEEMLRDAHKYVANTARFNKDASISHETVVCE